MKRCILGIICALGLLPSSPTSAQPNPPRDPVVLDSEGNVRIFYGVPVTLTRKRLRRIGFPVKAGTGSSEGIEYTFYTITAEQGVQVQVTFDDDGTIFGIDTESKNAVGPKGIGIGSTLAEVKTAWPAGKFIYGWADGYYVTYVTGSNVLFRFNPDDMPRGAFNHDRPADFAVPDSIKVHSISLYRKPIPVSKPYHPEDYDFEEASFTGGLSGGTPVRADVVRIKRSDLRRISASLGHKALRGFIFDPSGYSDFDPYSMEVRYMSATLYLKFRYGPYKNCTTKEDDRNSLFVFFGTRRTIVSPSPGKYDDKNFVKGSLITKRYVKSTPVTIVHGCPVGSLKVPESATP